MKERRERKGHRGREKMRGKPSFASRERRDRRGGDTPAPPPPIIPLVVCMPPILAW